CASAWAPREVRPVPLEPAQALAVTGGDRPFVLLGDETGLSVLDPETAARAAHLDGPVRDLREGDIDGNGSSEVVSCGPRGIATIAIAQQDGALSLTASPLSDLPCEALEIVSVQGSPAFVIASNGSLFTLTSSLAGPRVTAAPLVPSSPPELATSGTE